MNNVVLIVGHNSFRKGAINYLGEHEYDFNCRIAYKASDILDNKITILVKNDYAIYESHLKRLKPDLAIELHFNFFGGTASGCEALLLDYTESKDAEHLLDLISKGFSLRNRGLKFLHGTSRGFGNLAILRRYCKKSFIIEPCFQKDKPIFENEEEYALLIADFLRDYLHEELKPIKQKDGLWRRLSEFLWGLLQYLRPNSKKKIQ